MASRELSKLLGDVDLFVSLRWSVDDESDRYRATILLEELSEAQSQVTSPRRIMGPHPSFEPREDPIYATSYLNALALKISSRGGRGQLVELVDHAINAAARNAVGLYIARRVVKSAAFGLFALDQHLDVAKPEHVQAGQGLWLAEPALHDYYRQRSADLTRWLEVMPP